jgi:hypothetical protein
MKKLLCHLSLVLPGTFLSLSSALIAQCTPADPSGRFDGSATTSQAGKLDISLNLVCGEGSYQGTLNTPLGVFVIHSGSFQGSTLRLKLWLNASSIALEANASDGVLKGTFATVDDKGPIELRRVGDAVPAGHPSALTAAQWHEDLAFLAKQLTTLHPGAFAHTPKPNFEAAVAQLDAKLDRLNADEIYVGFDQIANLIGDGHTYVDFPPDHPNLPLEILRFGADARIDAVSRGYERALGARIIAIEDTPLSKAQALAATVTPIAETAGLRDFRVDGFLTNGMMLHGLGITSSRDSASYVLAGDDSKPFTVEFKALAPGETPKWIYAADPLPLAEQPIDGSAACVPLRPASTLYCNVRVILQLEKPSQQMLALIQREHPKKVVIDLRQNGGGDYNLGLQYLVRPLQQNKDINRKGHLYVLIGPGTFSAAMSNAAQFRTMTRAILVGEPIGERPNGYQEPREFTLPNSRLVVRYSTRFYSFATGRENIILPDKQIPRSWADYTAGRDDALEWILAQK